MHQLLLVTITASGDNAIYLDSQQIVAGDPIDDSTNLVVTIGESLSKALNVEIVEVGVDNLDSEWNWDEVKESLISNGQMVCAPTVLPGIDGDFYQWLNPVETVDGLRHLHIQGDEINLSELMFAEANEAVEAIENNVWGWSPEDAEGFALVKVSKSLVPFHFNVDFEDETDSFVEQFGEGPTDTMSHLDFSTEAAKDLIRSNSINRERTFQIFPNVVASKNLVHSENVGIFIDWLKENVDSGIFFCEDSNGIKVYPHHVLESLSQSPESQIEILKLYAGDWLQDNIDMGTETVFGIDFDGNEVNSDIMLSSLV